VGTPWRLIVQRDAPPILAVIGDEGLHEARPHDTLELAVAAHDDVAVASAELHYTVQRRSLSKSPDVARAGSTREESHAALSLPGLGTSAVGGLTALGFAPLGLRHGDTLSYSVRVADNCPGPRGPHVVWSPLRTLTIGSNVESIRAQQARLGQKSLRDRLDTLRSTASANRSATEQLRYAADSALRGNGAWDQEQQRALGQRSNEARDLVNQLQQLARDLERNPSDSLSPLAEPTRQLAENEAEAARSGLESARRATDAAQRLNHLRSADTQLGNVSKQLDDLQRRLETLAQQARSSKAPSSTENAKAAMKGSGAATVDATELPASVRRPNGRAWGELPIHLRSAMLQATQARYRDDYARLIRLYFQEIAAGNAGSVPSTPNQKP
jgi:hypothetical protein